MMTWFPPDAIHKAPEVGDLIAERYMALRVLGIDRREDRTILHVRREYGPKPDAENDRGEFGYGRPRTSWSGRVHVLAYRDPSRIALCSCHGHPYPCRQMEDDRQAMRSMEYHANLIGRANDGCCFSCGEPVTTRQARLLAPEPNVMLQGFPPPLFHLRLSCRGFLTRYEDARRRALGADWSPLLGNQPDLTSPERTTP